MCLWWSQMMNAMLLKTNNLMLNSVLSRTFYSILTWIMFTNIRSISFSSQWNIGPQSSIHFFDISSSFHTVSLILLMSLIVFIIVAFLLLCFCNQVADEGCISSIYLKGKQYRPRRLKKKCVFAATNWIHLTSERRARLTCPVS